MTWEMVQFEEMEKMKEELKDVGENDMARDYADNNLELPSPFPLNLSLVLRLPVISIISPKAIIVPDKAIPYSIKSNPALVLIIALDKAPDKAPALASNARYRYRTCSITALSSL